MNFTIRRESIIDSLQLVAGVVERRQTSPILANALLRLSDQTLFLTSTDLEVEITTRSPVESINNDGEITVPARKLMDICRSLPNNALIKFNLIDQKMTIHSGRSRFTLSTMPSKDFPSIDMTLANVDFTCPQVLIKRLLSATSFAMAQQDVRFYLNGMLWELHQKQVRCVATDGHRLAMSSCDLDINAPVKTQAILPRKGVAELIRFLKDNDEQINIALSSNHMCFEANNITMISKLVDGKFPDYDRVVPKVTDNILVGEREKLKQAFSRVAILSNEKYHGVRLNMDNNILRIVANNPEQEEAEEEISVDYTGQAIEIGFNITYLHDIATILSSESIQISLSDANSSVLLKDPQCNKSVYVVMPMRL